MMSIDQEFELAKTAFSVRLQIAESEYKTQIWSAGPILNVDPYSFERTGLKLGKVLAREPTNYNKKFGYFFDEKSQIVLVKKGTSIENKFYCEFFFKDDSFLKSYLYNGEDLVNVIIREFSNEKLTTLKSKGTFGSREEEYVYEADKLQAIQVQHWEGEKENAGHIVRFKYDQNGVSRITNEFENGYADVIYKKE